MAVLYSRKPRKRAGVLTDRKGWPLKGHHKADVLRGGRRFACCTPFAHCQGALSKASSGLRGECKTHSSSLEAYQCYVKYLKSLGYTQKRRIMVKDGEPAIMLPRKNGAVSFMIGKAKRVLAVRGGYLR